MFVRGSFSGKKSIFRLVFCRLYNLQQEEGEEDELEILKCQQPLVSLILCSSFTYIKMAISVFSQPQHPFEQLLKWDPRETAEQLCLIDSALYSRVDRE